METFSFESRVKWRMTSTSETSTSSAISVAPQRRRKNLVQRPLGNLERRQLIAAPSALASARR